MKKILAVDDREPILEVIKAALEMEGYNVTTLTDPFKVEECIEKESPDLLILDVFMPGRSGFNIVQDFNEKGLYKDLPKMFITVLGDEGEKIVARAEGVDEYLEKPFSKEELVEKVEKLIG